MRQTAALHLLLAISLASQLSCQTPVPQPAPVKPPAPSVDPNGSPSKASYLDLGSLHTDRLDPSNDTDDWYRLDIPESGKLGLRLRVIGGQPRGGFVLVLTDQSGVRELQRIRSGGRSDVGFDRVVGGGPVLVWVGIEKYGEAAPFAYEILTTYQSSRPPEPTPTPVVKRRPQTKKTAPPPPPRPIFDTRTAPVLELERRAGRVETVVFALGQHDGIKPEMRGRLVGPNGAILAELEVRRVSARGSQARLLRPPEGEIDGETRVEIDVPRN